MVIRFQISNCMNTTVLTHQVAFGRVRDSTQRCKFPGIDVGSQKKIQKNFTIVYEIFTSEDFDDKIVRETKIF